MINFYRDNVASTPDFKGFNYNEIYNPTFSEEGRIQDEIEAFNREARRERGIKEVEVEVGEPKVDLSVYILAKSEFNKYYLNPRYKNEILIRQSSTPGLFSIGYFRKNPEPAWRAAYIGLLSGEITFFSPDEETRNEMMRSDDFVAMTKATMTEEQLNKLTRFISNNFAGAEIMMSELTDDSPKKEARVYEARKEGAVEPHSEEVTAEFIAEVLEGDDKEIVGEQKKERDDTVVTPGSYILESEEFSKYTKSELERDEILIREASTGGLFTIYFQEREPKPAWKATSVGLLNGEITPFHRNKEIRKEMMSRDDFVAMTRDTLTQDQLYKLTDFIKNRFGEVRIKQSKVPTKQSNEPSPRLEKMEETIKAQAKESKEAKTPHRDKLEAYKAANESTHESPKKRRS